MFSARNYEEGDNSSQNLTYQDLDSEAALLPIGAEVSATCHVLLLNSLLLRTGH